MLIGTSLGDSQITMVNPVGVDALPRIKALVENRVDLPVMPRIAATVMREVASQLSNADRLARLISSDEALAARIMRVSNSTFYRRKLPTTTLQRAVVQLGRTMVRDLVVSLSSQSMYRKADALSERLWEHAVATGLACGFLAEETRRVEKDEAFIVGLLHDVGKTVLMANDEALYREVVARMAKDGTDSWVAEEELFGCHHAAVGGVMLMQWELPMQQVNAILWHHHLDDLSQVPDTGRDLACVVHVADMITNHLGINATGIEKPLIAESPAAESLGLSEQQLTLLAERTRERYEEEKDIFS